MALLTHYLASFLGAVPVLAYCGTGKRAAQAVKTLKSKGYLHVLNAGAYPDLDYLKALP